jgi:hypothetical protein
MSEGFRKKLHLGEGSGFDRGLIYGMSQWVSMGLNHGDHHPLTWLNFCRVIDENISKLLPSFVHERDPSQ